MKSIFQKPFVLFVLIGFSALLAVTLVKNRSTPEHAGTEMPSKQVKVITAKKMPFRAKVTAYGNVEPAILLKGMAEVSGKIRYLHPDLKQGSSIPEDTVVVRIDPDDYKVALKEKQADLATNRSSLIQLQAEEKSTKQSFLIAQKNLDVAKKELVRIQELFEKKLVSRSAVDAEKQKVLQIEQEVEEIRGQLNTFASRKASVSAQIDRTKEQVKGQRTTLGRTEIKLPFNARIGQVSIEKNEFVAVGSSMFEALDVNGVEINAQLPIRHMRALVSHLEGTDVNGQLLLNPREVLKSLGLSARVRLVGGMPYANWEARVLRISESIDPARRTLGIVVGVDNPYEKVIPGKRPPLLKGMYTAIELFAPAREALVIPRKAVHEGRVYVSNKNNRLEIKSVDIQFQQGNYVVINNGIQEGEKIIVNDLIPIIEGMPLRPTPAEESIDKGATFDKENVLP